jgi:PepSY-associated TM region
MKRSFIFVHRWLGVIVSVLFVMWFASAIGMMYWDFPSVTTADRLAHASPLAASQVRLSPHAAYSNVAPSGSGSTDTHLFLNTFNGRPVYRIRTGQREIVIYADNGELRGEVSSDAMRHIAAAWTNESPEAARVELLQDVDQWTVQGQFRNLQPLWKYSWPDGQQVYVSQATGEVVQYTTSRSRLRAYLGPIPHWLYFTPLRKHSAQWNVFVTWSSAIGTLAALVGIIVGVWSYSPSRRYRRAGVATSIPYGGYKRWHMVLGLMFGLGAVTWAFSGMLSMEPFPTAASDRASSSRRIAQALRGEFQLAAFERKYPADALRQLGAASVKELELTAFAGEAAYLARLANGDTRIVPVDGEPLVEFDRRQVMNAVQVAASASGGADLLVLTEYDRYYLDRRGLRPLPVILAKIHDADGTRYYIDPKTARIVGTYTSHDWMNRWLYHGLHSLDFPWLYKYRPLWDVIIIIFMLGGTALSVTSVILAWQVLARALRIADH